MSTTAEGMRLNRAQTIVRTLSMQPSAMTGSAAPSGVWRPAQPRKRVIRAPEIAEPNFWDIVPDEKIRPVEDVPFFRVA